MSDENAARPAAGEAQPAAPALGEVLAGLEKARAAWAAAPTRGRRFALPRQDKPPVDVLLYRPAAKTQRPLPVIFNLHGGAWIGGDAVLMESFCELLAQQLPALVVNVNYRKADLAPLPWAEEELRDAVLYFAANAAQYGIDPARMVVGGHSAGAHIAAGAAVMLAKEGFALAGQMLVYPVVDLRADSVAGADLMPGLHEVLFGGGALDTADWASPLQAPDEVLSDVAPAMIIVCGHDVLRPEGLAYAKRLQQLGVPTALREYPEAEHGFLEVNRPDYPPDARQTPQQAAFARDAEAWLLQQLHALLG